MIDPQLRRDPISAGEVLARIRAGLTLTCRNFVGEYEWKGTEEQKDNIIPYWRELLINWDKKNHS